MEHTVTEMVLGVDLVKAQIMTAQEKSLLWDQDQLAVRGHAIECRLYAEDPYRGGLPSTGKIGHLYFPMGWGVDLKSVLKPAMKSLLIMTL